MAKHSQVEYVYNFGNEYEYRKVIVEIHVEETRVMLSVIPDNMMTLDELGVMLNGFQKEVLSQMRIGIAEECAVEIAFDGKIYGVELRSGEPVRILPA